MNEVTTIYIKEPKQKEDDPERGHDVTVKSEFLKLCPNAEELDMHTLATEHKIANFFHNPHGSAIKAVIGFKDGQKVYHKYEEYWLNGKKLKAEEAKKLQHDSNFNEKFNEMIQGDDTKV